MPHIMCERIPGFPLPTFRRHRSGGEPGNEATKSIEHLYPPIPQQTSALEFYNSHIIHITVHYTGASHVQCTIQWNGNHTCYMWSCSHPPTRQHGLLHATGHK